MQPRLAPECLTATVFHMYIPNIDLLRERVDSRFDFAQVTKTLCRSGDTHEASPEGELTRHECAQIVRKIEEYAYGPGARRHTTRRGRAVRKPKTVTVEVLRAKIAHCYETAIRSRNRNRFREAERLECEARRLEKRVSELVLRAGETP